MLKKTEWGQSRTIQTQTTMDTGRRQMKHKNTAQKIKKMSNTDPKSQDREYRISDIHRYT